MKAFVKSATFFASAVALSLGSTWAIHSAAQAQANPDLIKQLQANDQMVAQGAELYKANGCNGCHGDQGKGDGGAAAALNPKPRNFHAKDGWKNGLTFAGLYKTLEEGLAGTPMGAFSHVPAKDRVALINHIRSLEKANFPEITAKDVETLQKDYNLADALTKGAAASIPVDKAIELLIAEDKAKQSQVEQSLTKWHALKGADAELLAAASEDPQRLITMLVNAGSAWKGNVNDFAKIVMYNADANGFRASNTTYTSAQWQSLQNTLKKVL